MTQVFKITKETLPDTSDVKGAIAGLTFILSNAAKYDIDEQTLLQEIQQLGMPKENSEAVARPFRETKDELRRAFAQDTYHVSHMHIPSIIPAPADDDMMLTYLCILSLLLLLLLLHVTMIIDQLPKLISMDWRVDHLISSSQDKVCMVSTGRNRLNCRRRDMMMNNVFWPLLLCVSL